MKKEVFLGGTTNNTNWRDELICTDNESVIQLFLHWKEISINKKSLI